MTNQHDLGMAFIEAARLLSRAQDLALCARNGFDWGRSYTQDDIECLYEDLSDGRRMAEYQGAKLTGIDEDRIDEYVCDGVELDVPTPDRTP